MWRLNKKLFSTSKKLFDKSVIAKNDKFVRILNDNKNNSEITVYIKGFLTRGENPENFKVWRNSHLQLCKSNHHWKANALGYFWQTGYSKTPVDYIIQKIPEKIRPDSSPYHKPTKTQIPFLTLSATTISLALKIFLKTRMLHPLGLVVAFGSDTALIIAQLLSQYHRARKNAEEHAPMLVKNLLELRKQYPNRKIRVVAHSLGCKLVIKAIENHEINLIDELHLLAPGITVNEFNKMMTAHQNMTPVKNIFIYHSSEDYMFELFSIVEGDHGLGYLGLLEPLPSNVYQKDVTRFLQDSYNKHKEYANKFPDFAFKNET